jgi:hypothetical protein
MGSLGLPELLMIPLAFFIYGVTFWIIWKFYQALSGIHENIAGIRRAIERQAPEASPES